MPLLRGAPTAASSTATTSASGAAGGETSLANLALLCRRHHRAVHEGGYTAEATAEPHDPVRFRRPDGTLLGDQCELPATDHRAVLDHNRRLSLDIDHLTAMPTWAGERLDLGLCVDALLSGRPNASRRE